MSTMVSPDALPGHLLAEVTACSECEADRRPRMYVCSYHEGFWDGYETALDDAKRTVLTQIAKIGPKEKA